MEEYAREPCPYRIVDDCGGAFAMGCIGGGIFQAIKGFRNAPSGFSRRMVRKSLVMFEVKTIVNAGKIDKLCIISISDRKFSSDKTTFTDYCR